jgi:integrase
VIDQARQRRVLGLYVVADDKGRQITKGRMERAWQAARAAAGVEDIQFRDIRAKSATEAERRGQDYQKLLGHTSAAMSERYLRGRRVERVEPLKGKL